MLLIPVRPKSTAQTSTGIQTCRWLAVCHPERSEAQAERSRRTRCFLQGNPTSIQQTSAKALLFSQHTQEQMFGADVIVVETFRFLGRVSQHTLGLVTERQVDGGGDFPAEGGLLFDLRTKGFDCVALEETPCQGFVLAQQTED